MTAGLLHHVEIYVSDLPRSISFWGWLLESLGYQPYQSWDKGKSFRLGETYLVFVQTEPRFLDISYHRCRVGLNHLAFHARSRQHIDELAHELDRRGITRLYRDRYPAADKQYCALFFEDPDRIKVELVAPEPE